MQDVNILALVKDGEKYIFLYSDPNTIAIQEKIDEYASNPDLSFTSTDAVVLKSKVKQESKPSRF